MKRCPECQRTYDSPSAQFCGQDGAQLLAVKDPFLGVVIDNKYRLTERIGGGGMGAVYLAEHTQLPRQFAVKVIRPEHAAEPQLLERFERELRILAGLDHPHIIPITDGGLSSDGLLYLVMKLIAGQSLRDILAKSGQIAPGRVVNCARQVCAALWNAHRAGVLHRDLKPDNVMVQTVDGVDHAWLIDFGIAKSLNEESITATGQTPGTYPYYAPELLQGEPATEQTDIYALGVMLYETLAGRRPFEGRNLAELSEAILRGQPRPLAELCPDLPAGLPRAVMRALAKDPQTRQESVEELSAELAEAQTALDGMSVTTVAMTTEAAPVAPLAEVFVSFAVDDIEHASAVAEALREAGVVVQLDHGDPGAETAPAACGAVLVLCSAAAMRSSKVKRELLRAWQADTPYLPVLLKSGDAERQMSSWLDEHRWVDARGRSLSDWLPEMRRELNYLLPTGASPRAGAETFRGLGAAPPDRRRSQPGQCYEELKGLRRAAGLTDQLWPLPASEAETLPNPKRFRGLGAPPPAARHGFRVGDYVRLCVESDREGRHLLLINEGADRVVYCLCPSPGFAPDARLAVGRNHLPSGGATYDSFLISGAPGREHLLAVLCDEPLGLEWVAGDPVAAPARVLADADVGALLGRLRRLDVNRWSALATYFDVGT